MWLHNCGPSSPLTMSFSVEICWNSHEKWLILVLNFKAPCVPRQRRSKPNVKQHSVKCSHSRQAGILCMPYSHWQSIVNVLIYFCHCSVLVGKIYFFPLQMGRIHYGASFTMFGRAPCLNIVLKLSGNGLHIMHSSIKLPISQENCGRLEKCGPWWDIVISKHVCLHSKRYWLK